LVRKKYKKYNWNNKLKQDFFEELYKNWINFCCYCGKDRLTHFKEKNWNFKRLYDIEHFLPRSKFPDLSVNLYNWLPVCMSCNQRLKKSDNPLVKWEVFHPYFWFLNSAGQQRALALWNLDSDYSFTYTDKKKNIIFESNHSKFFELWKIYLNSQDTFNIFNFIQDKRTKIKDELNNFENLKWLNEEEKKQKIKKYKNYFFQNYYPKQEQDILKFSNWKLKKDLIENINL